MSMRHPIRLLFALMLGVSAALLVSCGGSGKGLIPLANAGPLQSDFELVAQDAQSGDGNCAATEAALAKTEEDFAALPTTVNPGLRNRLNQGISNLHNRALELCKQPLAQTTTTSSVSRTSTPKPQPTTTTQTNTQTTSTQSTQTTPTSAPPETGGGTPAPGSESHPSGGVGQGGGTGAGGEAGEAGAPGASGTPGTPGTPGVQEGNK